MGDVVFTGVQDAIRADRNIMNLPDRLTGFVLEGVTDEFVLAVARVKSQYLTVAESAGHAVGVAIGVHHEVG